MISILATIALLYRKVKDAASNYGGRNIINLSGSHILKVTKLDLISQWLNQLLVVPCFLKNRHQVFMKYTGIPFFAHLSYFFFFYQFSNHSQSSFFLLFLFKDWLIKEVMTSLISLLIHVWLPNGVNEHFWFI